MTEITPEQLNVLSSSVRNEVYIAVRSAGTASASDIALKLGRSREAVHYHLTLLTEVGLVAKVGTRPGVKKPETLYQGVHDSLKLPPLSEASVRSVLAGIRGGARGYERAARKSLASGMPNEFMNVLKITAQISPETARAFYEMLEEAVDFAKSNQTEDGVKIQWMSFSFGDPGSDGAE